jgi:hypothetical protein
VVGAWRFELQTSCAQGRRLKPARTRILNAADHFAQFTVVGSVVSDLLFSIACTMLAMRKASSLPVSNLGIGTYLSNYRVYRAVEWKCGSLDPYPVELMSRRSA